MKIKFVIIISLLFLFLAFYIRTLQKNVKLQKEINTSLKNQISAVNKKNELLYQDFIVSQEQKQYYNKRYETLKKEMDELGKKQGNECVNQIVSEDLIKLLKK